MIKNDFEKNYKSLLLKIITCGSEEKNRTKVKSIVLFNESLNIDLSKGFPIITGKKIYFDKGYHEYIWFREGMHTIKYLNKHGIKWWDQYADNRGDLGKVYGYRL